MKVVLLHDEVATTGRADERDALVQVEAVVAALRQRGDTCAVLPVSLNLQALADELERQAPELVFNLVESLAGRGRLIHLVPALLDALGIPYTGVPTEAMFVTSNKLLTKRRLGSAGGQSRVAGVCTRRQR